MARKERLKNWAIGRLMRNFSTTEEKHIPDRKEADRRLDNLCAMAVVRSGVVGALSGLTVVAAALLLHNYEGGEGYNALIFSVTLALVGLIATGIELAYLYRDSLSTASRMAKVLDIPEEEIGRMDVEHAIGPWLIYAALGAPGYRGTLFGIDPLAKIGKIGLIIRKILKKIRAASSFTLFKAILRRIWVRMIGRVATRAYVELIALPIFILLNVIGMRYTMAEMRSRLVGHELTPKLVKHAFPEGFNNISPGLRRAIHEDLIAQITAARYLHPNHIRILQEIGDDWDDNATITTSDQRRSDRFMIALSVMSGKNSRRCRKIIKIVENRLGEKEVDSVKDEVYDAIHDLTPFTREWK